MGKMTRHEKESGINNAHKVYSLEAVITKTKSQRILHIRNESNLTLDKKLR